MKLKPAYESLEETLLSLREQAKKESISIHTFLTAISGRGKVLLLIFLSLGFAQIPGIAIILGLFISYLGIQIALGKNFIWIPKYIRHKMIASFFLIKVINQILKILKFMKRWSQSRYERITKKPSTRVMNGIMIALVGLCLALAPPIPLTGLIASVAVILIAIGLLNNDGVYLVLGYICAICYMVMTQSLLQFFLNF